MNEVNEARKGYWVLTPQGAGKIVWVFPDKTIAVQFPWGGGEIFFAGEVRALHAPPCVAQAG